MKNEFLRHTISTIDYRFQKSVRTTGTDFGSFCAGKYSRTPNEIINHIFQVINSTRDFIQTEVHSNYQPEKLELKLEIERFNNELKSLDNVLSNKQLDTNFTKKLIQGPISDVLTHIGQLSMLNGLNGNPVKGEDFSSARIKTGIN